MKKRFFWRLFYTMILVTGSSLQSFATAPSFLFFAPGTVNSVIDAGAPILVDVQIFINDPGVKVSKVEFILDGGLPFYTELDGVSPGRRYTNNPSYIPSNGIHVLKVRVTDSNNQIWESPIPYYVVANQAPIVSISNMINNEVVGLGDSVVIAADAVDQDGTIDQVEFFVNGASRGVDSIYPYSVTWDANSIGAYTIKAEATDNYAKKSSSPQILVNVNQAPLVKVIHPIDSDAFPPNITLSIDAESWDVDGVLTKVEFLIDGDKVGEDFTSPFSIDWPSRSGVHLIRARATDHEGAVGNSFPVHILINNVLPEINIISPINNSTVVKGTDVSLLANTNVDQNITKLEFFVDGVSIGLGHLNQSFTWSTLNVGTHTITVSVEDNLGTDISESIVINVIEPPLITITSPVNNFHCDAKTILTINTEIVESIGTINTVEFFADGSKIGDGATTFVAPPISADIESGFVYQYSYDWEAVKGNHVLTAKVTNDVGTSSTSLPINIIVDDPLGINEASENKSVLKVYPNPTNFQTTITANLEQSGETSLIIYNQLGEEISVITKGYLNKGEHIFDFNAQQLSSGIYLIRLINNDNYYSFTLSKE